ncbi:MAG: hypothetical protein MUC59_17065 [Saprospiraceae bacterium]|jgi:hypothetical protein|nr:hypothetical protein [Saprospiraceae bacterium]
MKNYLHILFLLLAAQQLSAQAPGYLGKRFYAHANGVFSVSGGPTANNKGLDDYYGESGGGFGINYHYGLQAGYAISRHQAIVLMGGYLKTGMYTDAQTPTIFDSDFNSDLHELFFNLKGVSTGIGYQWFKTKKGAIAPFGVYGQLHLRGTFVTGEILDKKTTYPFGDFPGQHRPLGIDPKYTIISVGLELGHNAIINDKFVLNYAVQFNWPLLQTKYLSGWLTGNSELSYRSFDYEAYNQSKFEEGAVWRLAKHELFGVKLGFGLLAF